LIDVSLMMPSRALIFGRFQLAKILMRLAVARHWRVGELFCRARTLTPALPHHAGVPSRSWTKSQIFGSTNPFNQTDSFRKHRFHIDKKSIVFEESPKP
jgi:hypothetical protein